MPFFKHIDPKHKFVGWVLMLIALGQLVFINRYSGAILFAGSLLGWMVWVSGYNSKPK